jgi:hypothetical protein
VKLSKFRLCLIQLSSLSLTVKVEAACTMASQDGIEVLSKGIGYGIVIGIGAFFAILMYGLFLLYPKFY